MDFTLIRSKRKTLSLELKNGEVIVRAPYRASKKSIVAFVDSHREWIERRKEIAEKRQKQLDLSEPFTEEEVDRLMREAKEKIPPKVQYYASMMGAEYGRVTIRCQKTRWGSCSAKKNLNFNCLLMLLPEEIRDAVIIHELCHLKEMNHSKAFYDEVLRVCPDYRERDRWLKENGPLIIGRLRARKDG